jgi:uncharacterized protein YprB with RNaseH-like and TPR domain
MDEQEKYAEELQKQRPAEAIVSFKGLGDDEPYVAEIPHVPDAIFNFEKVDILRRRVAARYYRPLVVVEHEIRTRWQRIQATTAPGPRIGLDYTR